MKTKTITISLISAVFLSACAVKEAETSSAPIADIDQQISDAVETSADANRAISEVEVATSNKVRPGSQVASNIVLPPDALQPVTVDWQGGLEPFLAQMAERANYTFRVTGQRPANEVMVSITANEEPLFGVVRRAGNMANGFADIAFNPTAKLIEIRYGG